MSQKKTSSQSHPLSTPTTKPLRPICSVPSNKPSTAIKRRSRNLKQVTILMLLTATKANPYNLQKLNSAFYLSSGSSPSAIPSQCIYWDVPQTSAFFCDNKVLTNLTMMVDPNLILPSYYLQMFYGEWDSKPDLQSFFKMSFQDLFNPTTNFSGSAGVAWTTSMTHTFGPTELFNQVGIYHDTQHINRFLLTGPQVIGSPYLFGSPGPNNVSCSFLPKGPIVGAKSYLNSAGGQNNYFCAVAFAYNTCSCTSALFKLSDYSLKTINWTCGNPPVNLAWTISNSLSGMTNYSNTNCGDYLLSPVTTSINGYTPVSIVTDGFITSTVGNRSSITLTNPNVIGTFDVLLQVTNPSGYNILGDTTLYHATPLYFFIKVVIACSSLCRPTNTAYIDCFTGNMGSTCGAAFSDSSPTGQTLVSGCINSYASKKNPIGATDYFLATTIDPLSGLANQLIVCFPETLTVTPAWVVFSDTLTNSKTVSSALNQKFSLVANPPSGTPDGTYPVTVSAKYGTSTITKVFQVTVCNPGPLSWTTPAFTIPNQNYLCGVLTINTSSANRTPACDIVPECVSNVNYSVKMASTGAAVNSSVFTSVTSTSITIQTLIALSETNFIFIATDTSVTPNLNLQAPFTINWACTSLVPSANPTPSPGPTPSPSPTPSPVSVSCPSCDDPSNIMSGENAPQFSNQPLGINTSQNATFTPFEDKSSLCSSIKKDKKTYQVLCRVQNSQNAFLPIPHVAMTISTGNQVRAYMQVLDAPTDWDCVIEATMQFSGPITKTLQSSVFPVQFSACVSLSDSCKLNTYSDNLNWAAPQQMDVCTDGIPVSTSINTDLCVGKVQTICTDPNYPGNKGEGYTTEMCTKATFELFNAATMNTLASTYPNQSHAPATLYSQITTKSPMTVTLQTVDEEDIPEETAVTVKATMTSLFPGILTIPCLKQSAFTIQLWVDCQDEVMNTTDVFTKNDTTALDPFDCQVTITGDMQCIDIKTGIPCSLEILTNGTIICETRNNTKRSDQLVPPTVKISSVNHKGLCKVQFSQPMNLILFTNRTYNQTVHLRYKYFLSDIQMSLKVRSAALWMIFSQGLSGSLRTLLIVQSPSNQCSKTLSKFQAQFSTLKYLTLSSTKLPCSTSTQLMKIHACYNIHLQTTLQTLPYKLRMGLQQQEWTQLLMVCRLQLIKYFSQISLLASSQVALAQECLYCKTICKLCQPYLCRTLRCQATCIWC